MELPFSHNGIEFIDIHEFIYLNEGKNTTLTGLGNEETHSKEYAENCIYRSYLCASRTLRLDAQSSAMNSLSNEDNE